MSEFNSFQAQEDVPNIEYFGADHEQAGYALRAAPNMLDYEVEIMPIDTPEDALATARERAAHLQAVGNAEARKRGAFLIYSSRKELSPEEYAAALYNSRDKHVFMKARMPQGASSFDLLREYYEPSRTPENNQD
jgi:hypothetical protein